MATKEKPPRTTAQRNTSKEFNHRAAGHHADQRWHRSTESATTDQPGPLCRDQGNKGGVRTRTSPKGKLKPPTSDVMWTSAHGEAKDLKGPPASMERGPPGPKDRNTPAERLTPPTRDGAGDGGSAEAPSLCVIKGVGKLVGGALWGHFLFVDRDVQRSSTKGT